MHACARKYMRACIRGYMRATCIRESIQACRHGCIVALAFPQIHAHSLTGMRRYMRAVRAYMPIHIHTCIHAYKHTCAHACMHTSEHAHMHAHMLAHVHAVPACLHTYFHAHTYAWGVYGHTDMRPPMCTCTQAHTCARLHTHIHACIGACELSCLHVHFHTCVVIRVRTHILMYTCV